MNVASILKVKGKSVATARPDETVEAVAQKLAARKIGAIVIVGDGGHVNGIISERDIIRAISSNGASALTLPVGDIMTKNVMSCHEASTLEQMMAVMTQGRFRHVPVIEDGSLVGIISIGDVVKHHIAEVEMEVTAMRDYLATG
ncbi:MAG: CBS domain-containing protein [Hyphomicrobiaceae bacterium]|nr:CBS domain-containing protein [Hyphomicrobiaceae bacterium]